MIVIIQTPRLKRSHNNIYNILHIAGFSTDAYFQYLATKFIFNELEAESPSKGINNLIQNHCGDSELLHRLMQTYDLKTFTDGHRDLQKDNIASYITAAGDYF